MAVVINSNASAAIASNNLAYSSQQLQKSLNKLSSGSKIVNPSDDAGGLAVAMKLTATSNRETELQSNLSDAMSYAQTQDGALQVAGSILDRVSQLETLYQDPTKNSSDKANYDDEFTQLQGALTALGSQTFNGIDLFGSSNLTVAATDDLSTSGAINVAQQDLFGTTSGFTTFSDDFSNLSNWTTTDFAISGASETVAGNQLTLTANTGDASATTNATFSGPFEINTTFNVSGVNGDASVSLGNQTLADYDNLSTHGTHSLRIDVDAGGNSTVYLDGTVDPFQPSTVDTSTPAAITLDLDGAASNTAKFGPITMSSLGNPSATGQVTSAASLGSLSLGTVTQAIAQVAGMRASNGAEQSRLNFAASTLSTNQTNLQSAISNISDVDVAAETTRLAKWNVLVQAGTSMLSQANQSAQVALKLIGG